MVVGRWQGIGSVGLPPRKKDAVWHTLSGVLRNRGTVMMMGVARARASAFGACRDNLHAPRSQPVPVAESS